MVSLTRQYIIARLENEKTYVLENHEMSSRLGIDSSKINVLVEYVLKI